MESDYILRKCGYKITPPSIVITYVVTSTGKTHRRTMPLRKFTELSIAKTYAEELRDNPRHKRYLEKIPISQIEKLISMMKDQMNGLSLEAAILRNCDNGEIDPDGSINNVSGKEVNKSNASVEGTKINGDEEIDPNEDLNKLSSEELNRKKAIMDKTFNENRIKVTDSNFQYDIQVDFSDGAVESCGWDSDNSESF